MIARAPPWRVQSHGPCVTPTAFTQNSKMINI